jgi:hypothetical protein
MTELSFRQITGRIVRRDPVNAEDYGVMVLPVDERLSAMAARIKAEAPVSIVAPLVESDPRWRPTPIDAAAPQGKFLPIDSTGARDFVTHTDGRRAPADLVALAELHVERTGSPVAAFEIAVAAYNDPRVEATLRRSVAE